jgi:uncharacterized protein
MKKKLQPILDFLDGKEFAIAGVSRDKSKFGYSVFSELIQKGFTIYPINPNAEKIDEITCFPDVKSLPDKVKKLYIVTKPHQTCSLVKEALDKGIEHLWIQQMSDSNDAMDLISQRGIEPITGECMYMYLEPVKGIHKFHRGIRKFFRTFPS